MRRRRPRARSGRPPLGLLEVLAQEPDGGGTHDVGDDRDVAVVDSLRDLGRLPGDAQAVVRSAVGEDGSWRLVGWAERACTWGVRTRDRDVLAAAAAAASLHDPDRIDGRDAVLVLALVSRACTLVGLSAGSVLKRARTMTDATGGAWLRDHLQAGAPLPPTHREVGTGSDVGFERVEVTWDPYVDLAHLLEERTEAGNHATETPEEDPWDWSTRPSRGARLPTPLRERSWSRRPARSWQGRPPVSGGSGRRPTGPWGRDGSLERS